MSILHVYSNTAKKTRDAPCKRLTPLITNTINYHATPAIDVPQQLIVYCRLRDFSLTLLGYLHATVYAFTASADFARFLLYLFHLFTI